MVWTRKVEDTIYRIYHRYNCHTDLKQMIKLKNICMSKINSDERLKFKLKDNTALEYFIIQTLLESIFVTDKNQTKQGAMIL